MTETATAAAEAPEDERRPPGPLTVDDAFALFRDRQAEPTRERVPASELDGVAKASVTGADAKYDDDDMFIAQQLPAIDAALEAQWAKLQAAAVQLKGETDEKRKRLLQTILAEDCRQFDADVAARNNIVASSNAKQLERHRAGALAHKHKKLGKSVPDFDADTLVKFLRSDYGATDAELESFGSHRRLAQMAWESREYRRLKAEQSAKPIPKVPESFRRAKAVTAEQQRQSDMRDAIAAFERGDRT